MLLVDWIESKPFSRLLPGTKDLKSFPQNDLDKSKIKVNLEDSCSKIGFFLDQSKGVKGF